MTRRQLNEAVGGFVALAIVVWVVVIVSVLVYRLALWILG